jgi:hypothetical protein
VTALSAAAVAEACGGVAPVEPGGKELAGGVVPAALDVEVDPGGVGCVTYAVCRPVRVPWPGVAWVVGEQVRIRGELDAHSRERGPDFVQVARDQRACVRVDGQPAVLMSLGVLADLLAPSRRS